MKKAFARFTIALFLLNYLGTATAFKLKTHVWVAQEVINDLQDGYLTFKKTDGSTVEVFVGSGVAEAILNNQAAYRMGHIGPDAVPDVVVGQNVVHPGETGWHTDDWLEHILQQADWDNNEQSLAFAYGYLGHAAGDTFAHSYVNWYSGDQFLLFDGETDVERRHVALEGYIGQYTPPLMDSSGRLLGRPEQNLVVPARFIRDALIFNQSVNAEYAASPVAKHMNMFYEVRSRLQEEINGEIVDAIGAEMRDLFGEAGVVIDNSGGGSGGTNGGQISPVAYFAERNSPKISSLKSFSVYQGKTIADLEIDKNNLQTNDINAAEATYQELNNLVTNRLGISNPTLNAKLSQLKNKIDDYKTTQAKSSAGDAAAKGFLGDIWDDITDAFDSLLDEIKDFFSDLVSDIRNFFSDFEDFLKNPSEFYLREWLEGVDEAVKEYVNATSAAMIATMAVNGDSIEPLQDWMVCWSPVIAGIPDKITSPICSGYEGIKKITEAFASFTDKVTDLIGLKDLLDDFKERISDKILELTIDGLDEIDPSGTSSSFVELYQVLKDKDFTDTELNQIFSTDGTSKSLLKIPDVAGRVKAEMHVKNGYFDPEKYAVAYNAVQLAKLSILSTTELEYLAEQMGVGSGLYGNTLFANVLAPNYSILIDSIKTIDGNHQWMPFAPEFPRRNGDDGYTPQQRAFGFDYVYEGEPGSGFRPWLDAPARDKMFRKLFIGPLVPGIDAPETIGFSSIKPDSHSYDVCTANPFPTDHNDRTCTMIKLIPIITYLMY